MAKSKRKQISKNQLSKNRSRKNKLRKKSQKRKIYKKKNNKSKLQKGGKRLGVIRRKRQRGGMYEPPLISLKKNLISILDSTTPHLCKIFLSVMSSKGDVPTLTERYNNLKLTFKQYIYEIHKRQSSKYQNNEINELYNFEYEFEDHLNVGCHKYDSTGSIEVHKNGMILFINLLEKFLFKNTISYDKKFFNSNTAQNVLFKECAYKHELSLEPIEMNIIKNDNRILYRIIENVVKWEKTTNKKNDFKYYNLYSLAEAETREMFEGFGAANLSNNKTPETFNGFGE